MTALTVNAAGGETLNYWWHLRLAELVPFPPPSVTIVAQPLNIFGGVIGVEQNAAGFVVPGVCQANLPGFIAIGVEAQIDDLNTTRGDVRARRQKVPNESLATASVVSGYTEVPDDQYVLCRRLD
jgi:hypothetical protein